MLNRSKLLAASLIAATFVAGAAVGTVVSTAWGDGSDSSSERRERRPSYSERLQADLGLTDAQRDSVVILLQQRQEAMQAIWQDTRPRFDSLRSQIRDDIAALLDGEQRAIFEAMIARSDSSHAARGERGRNGRDHDH